MADSLEERLKNHARAFDGLLSLIPAKHYYGKDTSDQWQRKKQTKEEARQAKMAKLDPDTAMSAKDVLDSRAKKRKRDDEEVSSIDGIEGIELEQPKQGMKDPSRKKTKKKKQKTEKKKKERRSNGDSQIENEDVQVADANPIVPSDEQEQKQARDESHKGEQEIREDESAKAVEASMPNEEELQQSEAAGDAGLKGDDLVGGDHSPDDGLDIQLPMGDDTIDQPGSQPPSTVTPTPAPESPSFDRSAAQSEPSSNSSIVPSTTGSVDQPKKPMVDSETLRARLHARIEALRAARKADGPDGTRARNRQELIEVRRRKEEQRRAHKKELRRKAKEEEMQARERALALSRSPDMGSPLGTPFSGFENAFSFGRMAFNDGQRVDASLTGLVDARRKKGPQDALGAMKAAEAKQSRLNGLDEGKRKEIEEKDMWLNAKKRVHGEKVKDDTSLLKKTLKRQEKAKSKSEAEWKDRLAGVEHGKEMRQKKREENLKRRKEEKGAKGKKKKVLKRPGFEGSFRAKPRAGKA